MIPAERSHLHIAAQTHPGMSGKNNEDRFGVSAFRLDSSEALPVVFAIVSDGIGGHHAGEIAAELAVETTSQHIAKSNGRQPIETLKTAIQSASQEIAVQAERNAGQQGMGATCACCLIIDNRLYIATVGDSRIYLIRAGEIRKLTTDHTWVQEAIDAGILTPEQAAGHPNAHVIRRYLGSPNPIIPDTRLKLHLDETDAQAEQNQGSALQPGDQLVLCSDGLTDLVEDEEILAGLTEKPTDQAIDDLIDLANQRGGHDNITIVALHVPETTQPATFPLPGARRRKVRPGCAILSLIGAILIISALIGIFYFQGTNRVWENSAPSATQSIINQATVLPTSPYPYEHITISQTHPLPSTTALSTAITTEQPTITPWPALSVTVTPGSN